MVLCNPLLAPGTCHVIWNQALEHPWSSPWSILLSGYPGTLLATHSYHLNWAGRDRLLTHLPQPSITRSGAEGAAGHLPRAARFVLEPEAECNSELASCRGKAGSWLGGEGAGGWGRNAARNGQPGGGGGGPGGGGGGRGGGGHRLWETLIHRQRLEFQGRVGSC